MDGKMIRKIVILISILMFLAALDVVSTMLVLGKGGYETNPLAVYQWNTIGFLNSVILKMAVILFLGVLMILIYRFAKEHSPDDLKICSLVINGLLYFLLIWHVVVVANNFYWVWWMP